ncbi:MAG: phage tail protein [Candidatus Competibacteraceae bacterium]|nr:phage tail protein [Candidatus Competibacteraceae bacterium]
MRPFTTFNFKVNLQLEGDGGVICDAEFSECAGLELSMEAKTLREGGNNGRQIHLAGPVSYGQLTLKRGMTGNFKLWQWFEQLQQDRRLRASGEVLMLSSDRTAEDVRFVLSGCLPVKLKAPSLVAKDGAIAIEELQVLYETLYLAAPEA